ncbi:DnaA N-terminal domain-containing protein, partial [Methylopila musalis]
MLPASSERFTPSSAADHGADHEAAWRRATERLRAEYGEDVYTSWFGRIALDRVEDGVAHLSVPTRFLKSWIQSHYVDRITAVLAEEAAEIARIALGVRVAAPKLAASAGDVVVAPAPRFEPEERAQTSAAA